MPEPRARRCRMRVFAPSMSLWRPGTPAYALILPIADPADPNTAIVRYIGAPVAAVAAVSMAAAEEALRLIRLDYEALPFVVELAEEFDLPLNRVPRDR